jgi:hypothetical protein
MCSPLNVGSSHCLLHGGFLLGLLFNPEDGDDIFLQNVDLLSMDYMVLHIRCENSSFQFLVFKLLQYFTNHLRDKSPVFKKIHVLQLIQSYIIQLLFC